MKPAMNDADYNRHWLKRVRANSDRTENGCLVWRGHCARNGYASSCYRGNTIRVHRQLFKIVHEWDLPASVDVCHTCDNRRCIEIGHLWAGTRKQNVDDMTAKARHWSKVKTHCKHGHEFTPENTLIQKSRGKPGQGRSCKTCHRIGYRIRKLGWTREEAVRSERVPSGYNRHGVPVLKAARIAPPR